MSQGLVLGINYYLAENILSPGFIWGTQIGPDNHLHLSYKPSFPLIRDQGKPPEKNSLDDVSILAPDVVVALE